jgi:hypothetical protein
LQSLPTGLATRRLSVGTSVTCGSTNAPVAVPDVRAGSSDGMQHATIPTAIEAARRRNLPYMLLT